MQKFTASQIKRDDETQTAFAIRLIRDGETEACIEALLHAEAALRRDGYEHSQITSALIAAVRKRITDRAERKE